MISQENDTRQKEIYDLIENVKKTLGTPEYFGDHVVNVSNTTPLNFEEDDGYLGQFNKLYEGCSIYGECHYSMYTRFSITRGIDIVRHVTDLNKNGITDPIASLTQHISLGPRELELLFLAYLHWTINDEKKQKEDNK